MAPVQGKASALRRVNLSAGLGVKSLMTLTPNANKGLTKAIPYFNVRNEEPTMPTATLTSKGQITIPVEVRNDLKVDAGDRVEFIQVAPGRYEFVAATRSVTELKGMFGKPSKAVSVEDMNKAIARRGAAAK